MRPPVRTSAAPVRVLIVSDVHANPAALAVLPDADAVLCAGDLVDYGYAPAAAVTWCRDRSTATVAGNHDRALAFDENDGVGLAMREASRATRAVHRALLGNEDIAYLRALPLLAEVQLGGAVFAMTHAVADDVRRYAPLRDAAASLWAAVPHADVVVLGHTHVQGTHDDAGRVAVNPGSTGLASRGGTAQFALWDDGAIRLFTVPYDVDVAVREMHRLALSNTVRKTLERALREGRERPKEAPP